MQRLCHAQAMAELTWTVLDSLRASNLLVNATIAIQAKIVLFFFQTVLSTLTRMQKIYDLILSFDHYDQTNLLFFALSLCISVLFCGALKRRPFVLRAFLDATSREQRGSGLRMAQDELYLSRWDIYVGSA